MEDQETAHTCPTWCVANHEEQTSPDDAWHQSQEVLVPVVELVGHATTDGFRFDVEGIDLEIELEQRVSGCEAFVHFGVGEQRERNFRLSISSTVRLIQALRRAISIETSSLSPQTQP